MQCSRQGRGRDKGEGLLPLGRKVLFLEFGALGFTKRCQARVGKRVELAAQVVEALGVADEMNLRLGVHDLPLPIQCER